MVPARLIYTTVSLVRAGVKLLQQFDPPLVAGPHGSAYRPRPSASVDSALDAHPAYHAEDRLPPAASPHACAGPQSSRTDRPTANAGFASSLYACPGVDHGWLTCCAARNARSRGDHPTREQELNRATQHIREDLLAKLQRERGGVKRDRIKDMPMKRTPAQRAALASAAAEYLVFQARQRFEKREAAARAAYQATRNANAK